MEMTINSNDIVLLSSQINQICSLIEKERQCIVPTYVRAFFEETITESIFLRSEEWKKREELDVSNQEDFMKVMDMSLESMRSILDAVEIQRHNDAQYITMGEILPVIFGTWCRIFPFCKFI
jgi:hypothetical protein